MCFAFCDDFFCGCHYPVTHYPSRVALYRPASRPTDHQSGRKNNPPDLGLSALEDADKQAGGALQDFFRGLVDGGQPGPDVGRKGQVAVAADGKLERDAQPELLRREQGPVSSLVAAGEDGGGRPAVKRSGLEQQGEKRTIRLFYFGSLPPETYGLRYQKLGSNELLREPAPGLYVVSAHIVARGPALGALWLRRIKPKAIVGHAFYVYDVPEKS